VHVAGRVWRFAAVGVLVVAALLAPIALPVRMFVERARRRKVPIEQVAPVRSSGLLEPR
jgi:hypothetical protein